MHLQTFHSDLHNTFNQVAKPGNARQIIWTKVISDSSPVLRYLIPESWLIQKGSIGDSSASETSKPRIKVRHCNAQYARLS